MEDDGITIMEVLESDEGIYECSGKYGVVEIKASAQLTIKGKNIHLNWKQHLCHFY